MKDMKPLPTIYDPDFIAANQSDRADNVLTGSKWEQLEKIRQDIRDFKAANNLEQVIILCKFSLILLVKKTISEYSFLKFQG